jgi:dTDP-glucose 4,6-dehydratase
MTVFSPRRVLVTGGAGFIGSHFVDALLAASPEANSVVVLDALTYAGRKENLEAAEKDGRCSFVHADICDRALVSKLFVKNDFDAVVHLAAESHVDRSIEDGAPFLRTNVEGTFILIDVAREAWRDAKGARRFLHVSTDEVYGALGATGKFTEDSPYLPNSPYAASKASADLFVRAFQKTHDFPAIVTHCSNNYGPRQLAEKLIPLCIARAVAGEPIPLYGKGEQVREWIHVEDHCRGLWLALTQGRVGETYNLGGATELANRETVALVADAVDAAMGRAAGTSRGLISLVKDRAGHDFRYALDGAKAATELGFASRIGFAEGIAGTVRSQIAHPI